MCDQQRLRPTCAYAQSDQSLCQSLKYSIYINVLTHDLDFLSLKVGSKGLSESTLIKKSYVTAYDCYYYCREPYEACYVTCLKITGMTSSLVLIPCHKIPFSNFISYLYVILVFIVYIHFMIKRKKNSFQ